MKTVILPRFISTSKDSVPLISARIKRGKLTNSVTNMVNCYCVIIISLAVSQYRPYAVQQTLLPNKATNGCNILIIELTTSVSIPLAMCPWKL